MHAASGLFSWSMEILAFASRQFAPKIVDLSVRSIRILFYSLVSERSGRFEAARGAKRLVHIYLVLVLLFCRGTL